MGNQRNKIKKRSKREYKKTKIRALTNSQRHKTLVWCPWFACKKCFTDKTLVTEHINQHHKGITPVNCEWGRCRQSYETPELLEKHERKVHYKKATHKCTKCDKACPSFEALKIHFLHTHTNWKKTVSPEREIRDAKSSTAEQSTSSEPKATDCTDAVKENNSSIVTENGNSHTDDELNKDKSIPSNVQSTVASQPESAPQTRQNIPIVYECNTCGKCFKSQQALDRHKKVQHMDQSSLICTKCNEQFTCFEELKKHFLVTHTNWKKQLGEESSDDVIQNGDEKIATESGDITNATENADISIHTESDNVTNTTGSSDKCTNISDVCCKVSGVPKATLLSRGAPQVSDPTLNSGDATAGARLRDRRLNTPVTKDSQYNVCAKLNEIIGDFSKRSSAKINASNAKCFTTQGTESISNSKNKYVIVSVPNANVKVTDSTKTTYYIVNTHSAESMSNNSLLRQALSLPPVNNTVRSTGSNTAKKTCGRYKGPYYRPLVRRTYGSQKDMANRIQPPPLIPLGSYGEVLEGNSASLPLKSKVSEQHINFKKIKIHDANIIPAVGHTSDGLENIDLTVMGRTSPSSNIYINSVPFENSTSNNYLGGNVEMLDENCTQFDDDTVSSGDSSKSSDSETSDEDFLEGEASKDQDLQSALDEVCVELREENFDKNTPIDPFSEINEYEHVPRPLVIKSEDIVEHNTSEEVNINDFFKYIPAKRKHEDAGLGHQDMANRIQPPPLIPLGSYGEVLEGNAASLPLKSKVSEQHINFKKIKIHDYVKSVFVQTKQDNDLIIPAHEQIQNTGERSLEYLSKKIIKSEENNLKPIGSTVKDIDNLPVNIEPIKTDENITYDMPGLITTNEVSMDTVCALKTEAEITEPDTDIIDVDKTSLVLDCLSPMRIPRVYLERMPKDMYSPKVT